MAGAFKAGAIYAEIVADATKFKSGVKNATVSIAKFASTMKAQFAKLKTFAAAPLAVFTKIRRAVFSLRGALLSLGVGLSIKEFARLSGTVGSLIDSFRNLTASLGIATDAFLKDLREATLGTVSDMHLMEAANKAMVTGVLQSRDQYLQWAKDLRRIAKAEGQDFVSLMDQLVTGMIAMRTQTLRYIGINVDQKKIFDDYKKSLGIVNRELTEHEKRAAMSAAVTADLSRKASQLPADMTDAGDALDKFTTVIKNLRDELAVRLGPALISFFETAARVTPKIVDVMSASFTAVRNAISDLFTAEGLAKFPTIVRKIMHELVNIVIGTLHSVLQWLPNFIRNAAEIVILILGPASRRVMTDAWAYIQAGIEVGWGWVEKFFKTSVKHLGQDIVKWLLRTLFDAAGKAIAKMKEVALSIPIALRIAIPQVGLMVESIKGIASAWEEFEGVGKGVFQVLDTIEKISPEALSKRRADEIKKRTEEFNKQRKAIVAELNKSLRENQYQEEVQVKQAALVLESTMGQMLDDAAEFGSEWSARVVPHILEAGKILKNEFFRKEDIDALERELTELGDAFRNATKDLKYKEAVDKLQNVLRQQRWQDFVGMPIEFKFLTDEERRKFMGARDIIEQSLKKIGDRANISAEQMRHIADALDLINQKKLETSGLAQDLKASAEKWLEALTPETIVGMSDAQVRELRRVMQEIGGGAAEEGAEAATGGTQKVEEMLAERAKQRMEYAAGIGKDISDSLAHGIADGFLQGEKSAKVFANAFADMMSNALHKTIDLLTTEVGKGLAKIWSAVGGGPGAAAGIGQFAMGLIGVGGTMLMNMRGGVESTLDSVRSAVESTAAVRGIVAGPSNVAIEAVGSALKDALRQVEILLERIAQAVESGGAIGGGGGRTGGLAAHAMPASSVY